MLSDRQQKLAASFTVLFSIGWIELFGLPATELTKAQEITAGILMIAAILWVSEWVSLFVVSFLILALQTVWLLPSLSGDVTSPTVFYDSFFNNIILLFLGGFVLSALMQKYGLDLRFAQAILARTKGKPSATLLGIIAVCAFLSMWISNTATTAMMLTIIFPLLKHIDSQHRFRIALVLSVPFACNIGGIGTPIGTPPNAIALSYLTQQGFHISFMQWMLLTLPFMLVFLLLLWQLLLRMYPPDDIILEIKERETEALSLKHWSAIGIFVVTALGWFFGTSLSLNTGTVALFPIIVSFWFGLLDTADFRKLPWDILYIISGGLALGVALQLSGLGEVLVSILPLDLSPILILAFAAFAAGIMSTVMSNTATAGLVIPLVMSLDISNNMMLALVTTLALMCSMAMALPVTTPPNAIAFSSRAINTRDMMLCGGIMTLLGFVILVLLGPVYWQFIGNLFVINR
ncbi:Sodium-dependent dicarboxylate transporter SdcS [Thalassocella blandensis]|nr:Sodium-dependent dicarboxylate transporter SdcS [Thalassocella blandensis]